MPASNLFFRVGFVVAERILYIPRYVFTGWTTLIIAVVVSFMVALLSKIKVMKIEKESLLVVHYFFANDGISHVQHWKYRESRTN